MLTVLKQSSITFLILFYLKLGIDIFSFYFYTPIFLLFTTVFSVTNFAYQFVKSDNNDSANSDTNFFIGYFKNFENTVAAEEPFGPPISFPIAPPAP